MLGPDARSGSRAYDLAMSNNADIFRQLHGSGMFVMPNPWDQGSALILEQVGFSALATTSAGFARSIGKNDQELTRDELVAHVAALADIISIPLNVDSERLFPDDVGGIRETVRLLAAAGASGCSIEDYSPESDSIDDIDTATAAVAEAVAACKEHNLVLTARAENHLYHHDDLDDTIARLVAYREAGAEVLYAPGIREGADIARVVRDVGGPINVLSATSKPAIPELKALGVRRVSSGGALYNAAHRALTVEAKKMLG